MTPAFSPARGWSSAKPSWVRYECMKLTVDAAAPVGRVRRKAARAGSVQGSKPGSQFGPTDRYPSGRKGNCRGKTAARLLPQSEYAAPRERGYPAHFADAKKPEVVVVVHLRHPFSTSYGRKGHGTPGPYRYYCCHKSPGTTIFATCNVTTSENPVTEP